MLAQKCLEQQEGKDFCVSSGRKFCSLCSSFSHILGLQSSSLISLPVRGSKGVPLLYYMENGLQLLQGILGEGYVVWEESKNWAPRLVLGKLEWFDIAVFALGQKLPCPEENFHLDVM